MNLYKFDTESIDNLTQEMLDSVNVTMPNNNGDYSDRETFIKATKSEKETANKILDTIQEIIDSNKLPNI